MGKPVLLLDIIRKLIFHKTKNNPSLNIEIKEIGLKPGEKIKEILTLSNHLSKTIHPDILSSKEPLYSAQRLNRFFSRLEMAMSTIGNNKIKLCMKDFLKNEL